MDPRGRRRRRFTLGDFLVRFVGALTLVLLTYNPTNFSYLGWLFSAIADGSVGVRQALSGIALITGWTVLIRTTWFSLGRVGLALGGLFLAAFVGLLMGIGFLRVETSAGLAWLILTCIAALLAIGISWAHRQRKAAGHVEAEDAGD